VELDLLKAELELEHLKLKLELEYKTASPSG